MPFPNGPIKTVTRWKRIHFHHNHIPRSIPLLPPTTISNQLIRPHFQPCPGQCPVWSRGRKLWFVKFCTWISTLHELNLVQGLSRVPLFHHQMHHQLQSCPIVHWTGLVCLPPPSCKRILLVLPSSTVLLALQFNALWTCSSSCWAATTTTEGDYWL